MLRKLLIVFGALLGVLAIAIAALLLFVDVNRFKPQIEQAASNALHRKLSIDGELKLSVLPRLAVQLPKTTLSERNGDRTFAELAGARVGVELLPLLRGQINVDRVQINGLRATIERRKDGSTNVDDLIGKDAAPGKPATPTAQSGGSAAREFQVAGVELRDARITLLNPDGNVLQLSALDLTTGRLAPQTKTEVSLKTSFALRDDGLRGDIALASDLDVDLAKGQFVARNLKLESSGELQAQQPYSVSLTTPQLALGATTRSDKLQIQAKVGGSQPLTASAELSGIQGNDQQIGVQALSLTADAAFDGRKLAARLATPARFDLDAQTLQLPKLSGTIAVDDPALPARTVKIAFNGSLTAGVARQQLAGTIAAKFDETAMTAKFDVAGANPARVQFDVQADRLNLDRYLPAGKAPAGAAAPAANADANASSAPAPRPAAADATVDLAFLRGLAANGQLRIGQFQARGLKAADLRVTAKAAGGRLDLAPLSAQVYSGALTGSAFAAADGNRLGLNIAVSNVDLAPLLRDAIERSPLEGRGTVRLNVTTAGARVDALKRAVDGSAGLSLRDGAINGINIAQKLRTARALIRGDLSAAAESGKADATQKTDFSELNASFTINDGVATNNDLDAKSPLLRLGGAGRVDIAEESLDYTLRVSVVGTLKGQDGRDLTALRGLTVPVRLYGPLKDLSYTLDWQGVAKDALKERALDELQRRLGGAAKEGEKKSLEDTARDALKGLFRR